MDLCIREHTIAGADKYTFPYLNLHPDVHTHP
jgi:hypothetical protein